MRYSRLPSSPPPGPESPNSKRPGEQEAPPLAATDSRSALLDSIRAHADTQLAVGSSARRRSIGAERLHSPTSRTVPFPKDEADKEEAAAAPADVLIGMARRQSFGAEL